MYHKLKPQIISRALPESISAATRQNLAATHPTPLPRDGPDAVPREPFRRNHPTGWRQSGQTHYGVLSLGVFPAASPLQVTLPTQTSGSHCTGIVWLHPTSSAAGSLLVR